MTNYKYLLLAAPFAASALAFTVPATAQSGPQVLTVDVDRAAGTCTACVTATTQFQAQVQQAQQRQQTLQTQLQTAGQPLETAVSALNGRQPDAALQARITTFQQQQSSANQELQQTQQRLESTRQNISQQIITRIVSISEALRTQRGAAVVLSRGSALAAAPNTDITSDVVTQLNTQLTSISVTPLPQQAAPGAATPGAPATRPRSTTGR